MKMEWLIRKSLYIVISVLGDVRHSQASIAKIENNLKYKAEYKISQGIGLAMNWYVLSLSKKN